MREVRLWVNDGSLYQTPWHIPEDMVLQYIREWGHSVFPECKKANADHYVYAVQTFDDENDLLVKEVDVYMLPLNDEEFYKRTDALKKKKKVLIYAFHKGTAY